jgi:hypothetical protein
VESLGEQEKCLRGNHRAASAAVLRPEAEINTNPNSEQELREREAITERERLLDELGRCFTNLYL